MAGSTEAMPTSPPANDAAAEPAKASTNENTTTPTPSSREVTLRKRQNTRRKGPNYNQIHSKPLPLETHPLPAFHPTNPISLLRLAYTYVVRLLAPPTSHPAEFYVGYWSAETRSVHVTHPKHVRALWEMGFFGKGTLSRSEPSWLDREKARLKAKRAGGGTAEEWTNARRDQRRLFKLERARAEAEKIERQRLVEEGKLDSTALEIAPSTTAQDEPADNSVPVDQTGSAEALVKDDPLEDDPHVDGEEAEIENQEHLQLTMEEALFLSFGLGVLDIRENDGHPFSVAELVRAFANHASFPPRANSTPLAVDDSFMINYVTYHHFRSLGWVVRPGVKFSVDYMLYLRGPVFSHAEFAVITIPAYSDPYWSTPEGISRRRIKSDGEKDWWWLHCVNRVQSQVLKSLVLVYVDVPPPSLLENGREDLPNLLKGYTVREFILRRWQANRMRD